MRFHSAAQSKRHLYGLCHRAVPTEEHFHSSQLMVRETPRTPLTWNCTPNLSKWSGRPGSISPVLSPSQLTSKLPYYVTGISAVTRAYLPRISRNFNADLCVGVIEISERSEDRWRWKVHACTGRPTRGDKTSFRTQDRVKALASLEPAGNPGASSMRNHAEPGIVTISWLCSAAAGYETVETKLLFGFISQFYITIFPSGDPVPSRTRRSRGSVAGWSDTIPARR